MTLLYIHGRQQSTFQQSRRSESSEMTVVLEANLVRMNGAGQVEFIAVWYA